MSTIEVNENVLGVNLRNKFLKYDWKLAAPFRRIGYDLIIGLGLITPDFVKIGLTTTFWAENPYRIRTIRSNIPSFAWFLD